MVEINKQLAPRGDGTVFCVIHPTTYYDPKRHKQCYRCHLHNIEKEKRENENNTER